MRTGAGVGREFDRGRNLCRRNSNLSVDWYGAPGAAVVLTLCSCKGKDTYAMGCGEGSSCQGTVSTISTTLGISS